MSTYISNLLRAATNLTADFKKSWLSIRLRFITEVDFEKLKAGKSTASHLEDRRC